MTTPGPFVGIDVAKAELVVAVRPVGERWSVPNDETGVERLPDHVRGLAPTLVVLEATGGYEHAVVTVLLLAPVPAAGQAPVAGITGASEASGEGTQASQGTGEAWHPPRTPHGQPDMQGVWTGAPEGASHSLEEGCCEAAHVKMQRRGPERIGLQVPLIVDPADGRIPYQPWAAEKRGGHLVNMHTPTKLEHIDTEDRCLLLGAPRSNYRGDLQIRQIPGHVVILYEWAHAYRTIPLDGRPHLAGNIKLYNGDSRGHWEGNTLVVDVTNFNDKVFLDSHGSFYSEALHVVERWTLVDANTLKYEATLEDPTVFTRPWTIAFTLGRNTQPGYEFLEEACHEGVSLEHRLAAGSLLVATGQTGIHTHEEEKE